jgi:hypothetical protein
VKNRPAAPLPGQLHDVIHKILALRAYTAKNGFHTTRAEKTLLARLAPDDLAVVLFALQCSHASSEVITPRRAVCATCGLESIADGRGTMARSHHPNLEQIA